MILDLRQLAGKFSRLIGKTMNQAAYYATAAQIAKFWLDAGLTLPQACGLLAQADAESSLNPKAVGDHGQAFGLNQWHASRVHAIKKGCSVDLTKLPSLADQLKAALWELNGPESHAFTLIKQQVTAYDAGFVACRTWERPASVAQWPKRGGRAQEWFEHFGKNPIA
jgi:hypothetical protein